MSLGSPGFDGPITENFREKVEPLSLKSFPFSLIPFLSLFFLSFPPLKRLGQVGQVGEYFSCHMSAYNWFIWITSHPLSIIVDFHPLRRCHMSAWGPLGSPCLTNSALDTRHLLSHSKCAKCPALPSLPRKTCKFRLSRNSLKFNVVARFRETILTVKSVSSSEI